ncbi:flagellar assembly protein H [Photobacterium sp. ZSDE20]|uniref:Flagellar assembly protein FliH n=1 Tax=Photobacterium pectinilyticum TaxID=2906793 RepID=A0ABT1MY67_9GAMM|nr:flagellar assembly protein FliH [Photobacterium sp. ZSDE20]MCQ1057418.1 flagellar assembly protein H [Photobacterium sp. ZSDE20]MDD1821633.1 flagellar assembly protein H [Photobacterium sp. ZSDE20]
MFRRNKIMRLQASQFRSHRFPPLVDPSSLAPSTKAHSAASARNHAGTAFGDGFDNSLDDGLLMGDELGGDDFGFDNLALDDFGLDELNEDARLMTGIEGDALLDASAELDQQEDVQAQFNQGFQQGMTRGHEEGLQQGIEQGQQQGFDQGVQQGRDQGIAQGIKEGKAQFVKATQPFAQMHQQMAELFSEHERRQREQMCELVQKVAQQVIRCELALQPQQILALVEETLESLPGEPVGLKVKMASEEFTHLENVASDKIDEWNIVCDDTLRQGECRVVTKNAEADAGCEQRLDACMSAVKGHLLDEQVVLEVNAEEHDGAIKQAS